MVHKTGRSVFLISSFLIFNFNRADHTSNAKRGGVCIYYKEYLPLIRKVDICKLNECIVTEITVNNERCFLTCLYRSPNQNQEQSESFWENLIDVLSGINNQQPTCSILVGDFNAKLSKWCPSDKDIYLPCYMRLSWFHEVFHFILSELHIMHDEDFHLRLLHICLPTLEIKLVSSCDGLNKQCSRLAGVFFFCCCCLLHLMLTFLPEQLSFKKCRKLFFKIFMFCL